MDIDYDRLNNNVEKICNGDRIGAREGRTFAVVMMALGAIELGCSVQIIACNAQRSNHIKQILLEWIHYYSDLDNKAGIKPLVSKIRIINYITRMDQLRGMRCLEPCIIFTNREYLIPECTIIEDQ